MCLLSDPLVYVVFLKYKQYVLPCIENQVPLPFQIEFDKKYIISGLLDAASYSPIWVIWLGAVDQKSRLPVFPLSPLRKMRYVFMFKCFELTYM